MRLKILPVLLLCLFCFTRTVAQKRQNIFYLKYSGKISDPPQDADFVRIISEPDSGSDMFTVKEYYRNDKPKLIGKTYSLGPSISLEGLCTFFYDNGQKRRVANYSKDKLIDDVFDFYPDGKLYAYRRFSEDNSVESDGFESNFIMVTCNDRNGKNITINGEGYFIKYADNLADIAEEGPVKLGLKDGEWKGTTTDSIPLSYTETYVKGQLTLGHSEDKAGNKYEYTKRLTRPTFEGGEEAFYTLLKRKMVFPSDSKLKPVGGGRVTATFTIDTRGAISDIEINWSPTEEHSRETIKALKKMPNWTPAMQMGRPISAKYTMSLNFFVHILGH